MRRHVFPTAPSPTTTHLMPLAAMLVPKLTKKGPFCSKTLEAPVGKVVKELFFTGHTFLPFQHHTHSTTALRARATCQARCRRGSACDFRLLGCLREGQTGVRIGEIGSNVDFLRTLGKSGSKTPRAADSVAHESRIVRLSCCCVGDVLWWCWRSPSNASYATVGPQADVTW